MAGAIKGLKVQLEGETSGLDAAIKKVGKTSAGLNKELAAIQRGLKFDPKNTVLLAQKQDILKQKITATKTQLSALQQAQQRVTAMYQRGEIDAGQYREFQRKLEETKSKLKTFETQLQQTEQAQKEATKSTKDHGQASEDDGNKVGALAKKLVIAAAAFMGLRKAIGVGKEILENADAMNDMSIKTGITTERLQELQYIGEQIGLKDLEILAKAQAKFTKSMYDASRGLKEQSDAFAALGVQIKDSNGEFRDSKTVMYEALDVLRNMENQTLADGLAMQIFGRSAQELNPLIRTGSEELERLAEEARKTGAVMSEDTVEALGEVNNRLEHMRQRVRAAIGNALVQLSPVLTPIVEKIGAFAVAMSQKLAPAIQGLIGGLTGNGGLSNALSGVFAVMGIVRDIFVMAWPMIKDIVQAFIDFFAGPTGQAIIQSLLEAIGTVLQAVHDIFQSVWPAVQKIIQVFIGFLNGPGGQAIIGFLNTVAGLIQALAPVASAAFGALAGIIGPAVNAAVKLLGPLISTLEKAIGLFSTLSGASMNADWDTSDARDKRAIRQYQLSLDAWVAGGKKGPRPSAPKFAMGGIVPGSGPVDVTAHGGEPILPRNNPLRALQLIAQSGVLNGLGGSSVTNNSAVYNVNLNGRDLPEPSFKGLIASIRTAERLGYVA